MRSQKTFFIEPKELRKVWDELKVRMGSGVVILGSRGDGKAYLLVGITEDLTDKYNAGEIIKELAPLIDGGGGGRADMAQAGGNKPEKLDEALEKVFEIVGK